MADHEPAVPAFAPVDPYAMARREAAASQLKRVYTAVSVVEADGRFEVRLDGRPMRTPARIVVALPARAAAERVAAEWDRQGAIVQPATMPVARLVNTVLDGVVRAMAEVRADIVRFAGTDLLCYRADGPPELQSRQAAAWDPVVAWAESVLHNRFLLAEGIMPVAQPPGVLVAVDRAVRALIGEGAAAPFRLGALHLMTTLGGSALLALAVGNGALMPHDAWAKAHVDEDFQIERWSQDQEAEERRARRWADFEAAAALLADVG